MFVKAFTFDSLSESIHNIDIGFIQDKMETVIKVKEEVDKLDLDYDYIKQKIDNEYNIDIDAITSKVNVEGIKKNIDIEKIKEYSE